MADFLREAAHELAESDPLRAAQVLAAGMRNQTPGAKLSALRAFVAELVEDDPALAPQIAEDLNTFTKGH